MATDLLPLFPLSLVLVPSMPLPLHIFEDRYKEMMAEAISGHSEFGVVLAKEQGIANIGCTAIVEEVTRRYEDGRLDLMAIGQRRFRITSLDQEKTYLRAEVQYFNDDDASEVPPELRQKASSAYRQLASLEEGVATEPKFERTRISFQPTCRAFWSLRAFPARMCSLAIRLAARMHWPTRWIIRGT